jgi:hypothetical protein
VAIVWVAAAGRAWAAAAGQAAGAPNAAGPEEGRCYLLDVEVTEQWAGAGSNSLRTTLATPVLRSGDAPVRFEMGGVGGRRIELHVQLATNAGPQQLAVEFRFLEGPRKDTFDRSVSPRMVVLEDQGCLMSIQSPAGDRRELKLTCRRAAGRPAAARTAPFDPRPDAPSLSDDEARDLLRTARVSSTARDLLCEDALRLVLRPATNVSLEVDEAALTKANISLNRAVSLNLDQVPVNQALDLVLKLANRDLCYRVRDGKVLVTTRLTSEADAVAKKTGMTRGEAEVKARLATPVSTRVEQAPLRQCLDFVAKEAGVTLMIDRKSLETYAIRPDAPAITVSVRDLRARKAIEVFLRLADEHLTYRIDDGYVVVTAEPTVKERAEALRAKLAEMEHRREWQSMRHEITRVRDLAEDRLRAMAEDRESDPRTREYLEGLRAELSDRLRRLDEVAAEGKR